MKYLTFALLFLCHTASAELPHWTERAVYEENGKIYFVGVALACKDEVECRRKTLEAVKFEASTFLGGHDITGLPLQTQMIVQDPGKNGTVNMYRLTWTWERDAFDFGRIKAIQLFGQR